MDEKRLSRIEDKVEKLEDRLNDKIEEVKSDIADLKSDVRLYAIEVQKHVEGDEKIISEIIPFIHSFNSFLNNDMPAIRNIIIKEEAKKELEKQVIKKKSNWKLNLSLISGVLGIVYTLYKMELIKF